MKLTKKQQALLTLVENAVADTNGEHYKKHRCLYVVTDKKELPYAEQHHGAVHFSTRIVKALFELGLVEYSQCPWEGRQERPKNVFVKGTYHGLVPTGFSHPNFGWEVGDIGLRTFTCGSLVMERCYGVVVKVEEGVLTLRPLNFYGSENWSSLACNATKHSVEEALGHIAQQVTEISKKDHFLRYLERGY